MSTSGEEEAYGFRLGSISEPQDYRAELSGAILKSRLHIPHADHISETDKILSLEIVKGKNNDITLPSKGQACG